MRPLLLPIFADARGAGSTLSLVVFGVPAPLRPPVLGTGGTIEAFSWEGPSTRLPAARELLVDTSMPRGRIFLQVTSESGVVESNRVRLDAADVVRAEPPEAPQLVAWEPGTSTVLLVARDVGSARLVDVDGRDLPPGSFRCARPASELLREAAMECTVIRREPLGTVGFTGTRVRAFVQTPEGPVLTAAVAPP
ncbi:MAG: hypothetical protein JNJ54_13545 [Myxococcaceae bacterium]|nr:hypothetical protein [Myxococcaceae bacterium]